MLLSLFPLLGGQIWWENSPKLDVGTYLDTKIGFYAICCYNSYSQL
jgi:hypothetical protein